jgi:hypothetical protein
MVFTGLFDHCKGWKLDVSRLIVLVDESGLIVGISNLQAIG